MFQEFANRLGLNVWDWIGVSIALLSFAIACVALFISRNTLKSQRQTEKNTLPVVNRDIQQFLLNELIIKLFDGHIRLTALWYLLNEKKYNFYPSERILRQSKVPSETIFIDLFYENKYEYRIVQGFSDMVKDYNKSIEELEIHLKDSNTNSELLYREFFDLLDRNDAVATMWGKVMTLLFQYNDKMKSAIFEELLNGMTPEKEGYEQNPKDIHFYKPKEVYSDFLVQEMKREQMLAFMEERTSTFKKEFENYLIERR